MLTEPTRFEISEDDLSSPAMFQAMLERVRVETGLSAKDFYFTRSYTIHPALGWISVVKFMWEAACRIERPFIIAQTYEIPAYQVVGDYQGKEHRVYMAKREDACVEVDGKATLIRPPRLRARFSK